MAVVPDRPDFDEVIDAVWGDWVHDEQVMRGLKARAEVVANQTIPVARTDITGLTVTFTAVAGRWYRCGFIFMLIPGGAGGTCLAYMVDVTATADLQGIQQFQPNAGNGLTMRADVVRQFPAGTRTLKVQAQTQGANGSLNAAAAYPAQLWVEDIGPV